MELIKKKKKLEKHEKYRRFTIVNKEEREIKINELSTNYSKRQKKIHKCRTIRETPTLRPTKKGPMT